MRSRSNYSFSRNILAIVLLAWAFFCSAVSLSAQGQQLTEKRMSDMDFVDHRPDLYVVTIDIKNFKPRDFYQVRCLVASAFPHSAVECRVQDSVVILQAGIPKKTDEDLFARKFVHHLAGPITYYQIMGTNDLFDKVCAVDQTYPSLSRPFSLYFLTIDGFDFTPYRNIYHLLVSDRCAPFDSEADLKLLRKKCPTQCDQCFELADFIENRDGELLLDGGGVFSPLPTSSYRKKRFYATLTRFDTYEDQCVFHEEAEHIVHIREYKRNKLSIALSSEQIDTLLLHQLSVNGTKILGHGRLYKDQPLEIEDRVIARHRSENDTLWLKGFYVSRYDNHILGSRTRIEEVSGTVVCTPEVTTWGNLWILLERIAIPLVLTLAALAVLSLTIFLLVRYNRKTVLEIIIKGKDYRISRRAFKKMNVQVPYWLVQEVDGVALPYLDKGIRCVGLKRALKYPGIRYIITDRPVQILEGECSCYKGKEAVSREFFYEALSSIDGLELKNRIVYVITGNQWHGMVRFKFEDRIFCIGEGKKPAIINDPEPLLCLNKKALSAFCTSYDYSDVSSRNNVLINILPYHEKRYAVLNIYDRNSQNHPDTVYLRYVLVVDESSGLKTIKDLKRTAKWVLRSEKQKMGSCEWQEKGSPGDNFSEGIYNVVTPSITCYLYFRSNKRVYLVYSPFQHDLQPNLNIDLPKEPFALLHFALFANRLRVVGAYERYYDNVGERTVMRLGGAGSNTVQEFLGERIDRKFAWGDIQNGFPRTCDMSLIKKITGK